MKPDAAAAISSQAIGEAVGFRVTVLRGEPSINEMITLPLLGIAAMELFHSRDHDLYLIFIPWLIVFIRVYLSQFQVPRSRAIVPDPGFQSAVLTCVAWNQIAAGVLLVLECAAYVVGGGDTYLFGIVEVPAGAWGVVGILYAIYVYLRLRSRRHWLIAESVASAARTVSA